MTTKYYVRVYCEDEDEYKRIDQDDTIDENWIPTGCENHTIRDFVIEKKVVTE